MHRNDLVDLENLVQSMTINSFNELVDAIVKPINSGSFDAKI